MVGMKFNLVGTIEERVNKEGKAYKCMVVKISDNIEKLVFFNPAELELLRLHQQSK